MRRRGSQEPTDETVLYVRGELPTEKLNRGRWPRDIARIRTVLPQHLQSATAPGTARYGSWFVFASAHGQRIGYGWAVHSVGDHEGAYIEEVAVLKPYQGRGIGSQLVREVAAWMLELGRPALTIHPISGDGWVVQLGFREVLPGVYRADAHDLVG